MRIVRFESEPFHTLKYSLGASAESLTALLPFHRATVEGLPKELDTIIATADLQGIVRSTAGAAPKPLGEALAVELDALRARGELSANERTAALLAGDLHVHADEGDVRSVWLAVASACRWVAGVAGNHDAFGPSGTTGAGARIALEGANVHFLDDSAVKLDGIRIGGVSGIVSEKAGSWNRDASSFTSAVARLAEEGVDVLLCHDGPNVSGTELAGWPCVRQALEGSRPTLVVRGHDAWSTPLATLANGTQVLNVEGGVVLLRRAVELT